LVFFGHIDIAKLLFTEGNSVGLLIIIYVAIGPLYVLNKIFEWFIHNWSSNPIAENLSAYCNNNTSWLSIASDINTEYGRFIELSKLYLGT